MELKLEPKGMEYKPWSMKYKPWMETTDDIMLAGRITQPKPEERLSREERYKILKKLIKIGYKAF